jgi:hypothetical protein
MPTIVQNYGPIYGEAVNGTVQGRPNGSVYVPISNTIAILYSPGYVKTDSGRIMWCDSLGNNSRGIIVAEAQDLASHIEIFVYSDAACTTQVGTARVNSAGSFNLDNVYTVSNYSGSLTTGTKYYVRAQLMNNSTPVATSNAEEVEAV